MERIKFYFDEHVPQAVADGLRRRGVDVLVVQDTDRRGAPDDEQLAFASQQGRVNNKLMKDDPVEVMDEKAALRENLVKHVLDQLPNALQAALPALNACQPDQRKRD